MNVTVAKERLYKTRTSTDPSPINSTSFRFVHSIKNNGSRILVTHPASGADRKGLMNPDHFQTRAGKRHSFAGRIESRTIKNGKNRTEDSHEPKAAPRDVANGSFQQGASRDCAQITNALDVTHNTSIVRSIHGPARNACSAKIGTVTTTKSRENAVELTDPVLNTEAGEPDRDSRRDLALSVADRGFLKPENSIHASGKSNKIAQSVAP